MARSREAGGRFRRTRSPRFRWRTSAIGSSGSGAYIACGVVRGPFAAADRRDLLPALARTATTAAAAAARDGRSRVPHVRLRRRRPRTPWPEPALLEQRVRRASVPVRVHELPVSAEPALVRNSLICQNPIAVVRVAEVLRFRVVPRLSSGDSDRPDKIASRGTLRDAQRRPPGRYRHRRPGRPCPRQRERGRMVRGDLAAVRVRRAVADPRAARGVDELREPGARGVLHEVEEPLHAAGVPATSSASPVL